MARGGTLESKCVTKIVKRFRDMGSELSRDDISDVLNELSELAREKGRIDKAGHTAGDYGRQLFLAARELTEREKLAQVIEKRQRAINILRREGVMRHIETMGVTPSRGIEYVDVGSIRKAQGSALSLDATGAHYEGEAVGRLLADLRSENVDTHVRGSLWLGNRDKALERRTAEEMSRSTGGADRETGDRVAAKLGMIFAKHIEIMRREMNAAGAFISKANGYVIAQTHDQFRIAKAGFDKWYKDIVGKLDERTFEGVGSDVDARKAWLKDVFENLQTGNHLKQVTTDGGIPGFKGPGNLAKRLSASRTLHFKTGGDWFDYNELYGHGSLFENIFGQLQRHARAKATMQIYGANPEAMRSDIIDRYIIAAKKEGNGDEVARLEGMKRGTGLAQFRSAANIHYTDNATWARHMNNARAVLNMSHLGTSLLGQFSDLMTNALVLRHNGLNILESMAQSFAALAPGRFAGDRREFGELLGAGTEGLLGEIHSKFSAGDVPAGVAYRLQSTFFKLNGQQWWQDRLSGSLSTTLAKNLAMKVGTKFDDLPVRLRTNLQRYDIGPKEWDKLGSVHLTEGDSGRYLMTDAIAEVDSDLARKVGIYYSDQTREGMSIPGARERGWIEQFGNRGSFSGEAARMLFQFKTFIMSFTNKHLGRELYRDGTDFSNLAFMVALALPLGYASLTAKDLIKGRSPREVDPTKEHGFQTWLDSFAQAGGGGLIGDAMFANYADGGGLLALAGPGPSQISQLLSAYSRVRDNLAQGKSPTAGMIAQAASLVGNNMPFANLIGFRQALDWMVLYQLTEFMAPGSLAKREQRLRQRTGQTMFLSPARAIPYGGGGQPVSFEGLR